MLPIQDDVISEAEFVVEKIAKVFSVHGRFPVDLKVSFMFYLILDLFNHFQWVIVIFSLG